MIGSNAGKGLGEDGELTLSTAGGKWEDEEERRFFEDIQDLRDFVPKSMLGLEDGEDKTSPGEEEKKPDEDLKVDMKKLDEELAGLENKVANGVAEEEASTNGDVSDEEEKWVSSWGIVLLALNRFLQRPDTHSWLTQDRYGHQPSISPARSISAADGITHQAA